MLTHIAYETYIKEPMSLTEIERKVAVKKYSIQDFVDDITLIIKYSIWALGLRSLLCY